jgi:hypothetical protein
MKYSQLTRHPMPLTANKTILNISFVAETGKKGHDKLGIRMPFLFYYFTNYQNPAPWLLRENNTCGHSYKLVYIENEYTSA